MQTLRIGICCAILVTLAACSGGAERAALPPATATPAEVVANIEQGGGPPVEAAPADAAAEEVPPSEPAGPLPAAWAAAPDTRADAAGPPPTFAAAALLLDEASGSVLAEKNGYTPLPPASLTKIATAIVAIEKGNLDDVVETDVDSTLMRGSSLMGLLPGDKFTLRDLLYGLMLPSGNDAALAIGRYISGSDEAFVAEMNALLARLGLTDSHFANAHGLGGRSNVVSPYDLAILARYGMSMPAFREIVSANSWTAQGSRTIEMNNLINGVLYSVDGADGVKSGYTNAAGRTLVASAERDGRRLYAVVLNDQSTEADAAALLDWGFSNFEWKQPEAVVAAEPAEEPPAEPAEAPADEGEVEALRADGE